MRGRFQPLVTLDVDDPWNLEGYTLATRVTSDSKLVRNGLG